jgi:uncharacterized protein YjbJ (UPF0337 family)
MRITDKITGRLKQAAGDLTGNQGLRTEGLREERKAEAKEEHARLEEEADRKAAEVADLERRTSGRRSTADRAAGASSRR